jgi:hypothetical protein
LNATILPLAMLQNDWFAFCFQDKAVVVVKGQKMIDFEAKVSRQ